MILMKPSFTIEDDLNGEKILASIERAGRTCYKSEDRITEDSARKFVAMIISRGHETVIEHEKVTVRIICDRGVTHELVRHRIATFSQESTRYCDYGKGGHVAFIIPPWVEDVKPGTYEEYEETPDEAANDWLYAMWNIEGVYRNLRAKGWRPEQARSVLPNSLKAEIVMTANLREWRHFFRLRTAPAAHPQMREIAVPLLLEMKQRIPVVFDDIEVPS